MEHKDKDKQENLEFPDQKIVGIEMRHEVENSFIAYSMSVIMSRALPDVRDGLKPVHRRILYAMYEDHLTYDKAFRKSATTVGNVLGRYHPHGDSAVYDTMVRLAQPFSMRYPLIEGHGNFGSVDGDPAAAYRYTEARLAKLSNEMMSDIDKNVVDFDPNFDNRLKEPRVLPSRFPNLLVNGSIGIAVGMATYIPPHNLGEVIDGTIYQMENPDCTVRDLMQFIKGPDFPTAATLYGSNGIYEAYSTGRGRVMVRAKCNIEEEKHRIVVTEIPYQVNKSMLVESMAALVKDKRIEGITDIRDESGRDGMRIVVDYRRDANGQVILNQLYKYTQLQDTCAFNMLALVDNVPRVLNLKQILGYYIKHQEDVITRRIKFDLEKAKREAHILEGLRIATDNIDEVIEIIKKSASIPDAKEKLMARFSLDDIQAQAIVDMTLGRLSGLERQKVEERLAKLYALIEELTADLNDEGRIKEIIKTEMLEIKAKFADPRRTELVAAEDDIVYEDLIERHTCVVTMTHGGYIKRQPADTYSAQKRGGKGIIGMATKEEDYVEDVIAANSHALLMFFTNTGKVHTRKTYQIPEAGRTAKGSNIVNILELEAGEKVTAIISVPGFSDKEYLFMVTKRGIVKKTLLSEFEYQRKGGKIALTLDDGDELVYVKHTSGNDDIIIATHDGLSARFGEEDVRPMGRGARGVKGMTLSDGDYIVGCAVISEDKALLTITEGGFGKRCEFDNFSAHNRGVKGVMCHGISERTGKLAGIAAVGESDDIMMITNDGTIIRTPVSGIPFYGRSAGGVIVMRLSEGSSLVNFARLENDEELEAEGMASDEGTAAIAPAESDEKVDPTEDEIDLGGGAGNKPDEDDDI
ncbi:MAG: DNA gyrase subunit A [Clostridiales bacterium]|nr:DNA gyrase subunit A [Clostridiales bacterium]MDY4435441.1 DNA gyrase subunit A [Candidatus Flemingibacterium sp.]